MALTVDTRYSERTTAALTFTPELPLIYEAGHLLVAYICVTGGDQIIAQDSGPTWTIVDQFRPVNNYRLAFAWRFATSSNETPPTFKIFGATNRTWWGVVKSYAHAHPSAPIDTYTYTSFTETNNLFAAPTITTNYNNSLLQYCIYQNVATTYCNTNEHVSMIELFSGPSQGAIFGISQQLTAGLVPAVNFHMNQLTSILGYWIIAIRDDGDGYMNPYPTTRQEIVRAHNHPEWLTYNNGANYVWEAPSTIAASWAGVTASNNIVDITSAGITTSGWTGNARKLTASEDLTGITRWVGAVETLGATYDFSDRLMSINYLGSSKDSDTYFRHPQVVLIDSLGNWASYYLLDASYTTAATGYWVYLDPTNGDRYAESVTPVDLTDIVKVGYIFRKSNNNSVGGSYMAIRNLWLFDKIAIVGGSPEYPVNAQSVKLYSESTAIPPNEIVSQQGVGQFIPRQSLQFGNGTQKTVVNLSGNSFEFPYRNWQWLVPELSSSVIIYASSVDIIDLSSGIFNTGAKQSFTIHASSSTSATYNFSNTSFNGWVVTWKTGITCNNAAFNECYEIDAKGAVFNSCTIKSSVATSAALSITDGAAVTDCTFTKGSETYAIEIDAAGSFDLTGNTYSGYSTVINVSAASGTVNITLASGESTPSYTSAGATVNFLTPDVYQEVTISGATAGSRIQIYDTTSSTELYNGTPTFPYTWTDGSPAAANRAIRLRCSYVSGTSAKEFIEQSIGTCGQTEATKSVSYLVNQVDDETYNTNGIDGPSIYATSGITFTDSSPDVVNCDISGGSVTHPTIYACFVHWMNTSTGITDDITYIQAPDPANYIYTNMKIKNTSSPEVDLSVTGGWGRDSVTGLSITLRDTTGGSIGFSADHAIAYSAGSGLTAGQDATLTSIGSIVSTIQTAITSTVLTVAKFLALK